MLLNLFKTDTRAIEVLAGVSRERGIELLMTFKKSVNQEKFLVFLEKLRARNPFDEIFFVMDNLHVHKTLVVKERYDELGFEVAYIPPYSPQFNCIEEI